jgi:hypothetical protein
MCPHHSRSCRGWFSGLPFVETRALVQRKRSVKDACHGSSLSGMIGGMVATETKVSTTSLVDMSGAAGWVSVGNGPRH